jgi:hypothetical protein
MLPIGTGVKINAAWPVRYLTVQNDSTRSAVFHRRAGVGGIQEP